MKLLINAVTKLVLGFVVVALLLFVPAGSINYFNGWLFIALLFIPMTLLGVALFFKAPDLLKKRLNFKEKESAQKGVTAFSAFIFLFGFIAAGLDNRFELTKVPHWLIILSSIIFILTYILYAEVMRENEYLSRTVEIQENQKVIDTGLYGIIRHPMYTVTIVMFLSIPFILGSFISLLFFLPYPFLIAIRINNEEKILEQGLAGYSNYKKRVKYRLIPLIW